MSGVLRVRVCAAREGQVLERELELPAGSTVGEAAAASGLAASGWTGALGVYGVAVEAGQPLQDGDRVELLLPLQVEPRARRRARAERRR